MIDTYSAYVGLTRKQQGRTTMSTKKELSDKLKELGEAIRKAKREYDATVKKINEVDGYDQDKMSVIYEALVEGFAQAHLDCATEFTYDEAEDQISSWTDEEMINHVLECYEDHDELYNIAIRLQSDKEVDDMIAS